MNEQDARLQREMEAQWAYMDEVDARGQEVLDFLDDLIQDIESHTAVKRRVKRLKRNREAVLR